MSLFNWGARGRAGDLLRAKTRRRKKEIGPALSPFTQACLERLQGSRRGRGRGFTTVMIKIVLNDFEPH